MKYFKGTVNELAEELEKLIDWKNGKFPFCNYALCPLEEEKSPLELCLIANHWYGIHKIDSGFDNYDDIEVVSNYWGGGCGQYAELNEDYDVVADIAALIEATLDSDGYYDDNCLLVADMY